MKPLRIIIASPLLSDRIIIEKSLARNGCYRVVPLSSLHDVIKLSKVPGHPVDLLIIDNRIIPDGYDDLFFETSHPSRPSVHFIIFYGDSQKTSSVDYLFHSPFKYYIEDIPTSDYRLNTLIPMIQAILTRGKR